MQEKDLFHEKFIYIVDRYLDSNQTYRAVNSITMPSHILL